MPVLVEIRDGQVHGGVEAIEGGLGGGHSTRALTTRRQWSWDQRGALQGRLQGQAMVLRRLIARRFGEATAGQVSDAVEELTGNEGIDKVTDALFECGTSDEFIERARTA